MTKFTNIFGTSVSEATMRSDPKVAAAVARLGFDGGTVRLAAVGPDDVTHFKK